MKRASDGAYQRPSASAPPAGSAVTGLSRAVTEFVTRVDRVQNLIVLRTGPGQAHAAARLRPRERGDRRHDCARHVRVMSRCTGRPGLGAVERTIENDDAICASGAASTGGAAFALLARRLGAESCHAHARPGKGSSRACARSGTRSRRASGALTTRARIAGKFLRPSCPGASRRPRASPARGRIARARYAAARMEGRPVAHGPASPIAFLICHRRWRPSFTITHRDDCAGPLSAPYRPDSGVARYDGRPADAWAPAPSDTFTRTTSRPLAPPAIVEIASRGGAVAATECRRHRRAFWVVARLPSTTVSDATTTHRRPLARWWKRRPPRCSRPRLPSWLRPPSTAICWRCGARWHRPTAR